MTAGETAVAGDLKARPLRQDDARGVALLVAGYFAELGVSGGMSFEQTRQLFATPWLEGGSGLVLEHRTDIVGYGFVRPSQWKGSDSVQFGLTLKRGYRDREVYQLLTAPLLSAASAIANERRIENISIHLRKADTFHPPILFGLGFHEHPVSMLGFSHDLRNIPNRPLPPEFRFRSAKLPGESPAWLGLMTSIFDDRGRQGEPINEAYLSFIAAKPGFDPEQVLVVEDQNGPVGGGIIDVANAGPGGIAHIMQIGVLPACRRRGIGSALVDRELNWLKDHGAGSALAGMFSSNLAATLFWRLGFRPDPSRTFRFFLRDTVRTAPKPPRRH